MQVVFTVKSETWITSFSTIQPQTNKRHETWNRQFIFLFGILLFYLHNISCILVDPLASIFFNTTTFAI